MSPFWAFTGDAKAMSMKTSFMELEKMIMLFIRLVLQLEDHGQKLRMLMLLIWLTQMDICMELEQTFMFIELYQMVLGADLLIIPLQG